MPQPSCPSGLETLVESSKFEKTSMNAPLNPPIVPPYRHTPLFPLGEDRTAYRRIATAGVRVERVMGRDMLVVSHEAMRALAEAAFIDINHLLRPGHLASLKAIVEDP